MSAYVVVEIDVHEPEEYEEYKRRATPTVEAYGGRYIARGGHTEVLEGEWHPKRVVILEFDSVERAKEWLESDEYREARAIRHRTASTNMIVVAGT